MNNKELYYKNEGKIMHYIAEIKEKLIKTYIPKFIDDIVIYAHINGFSGFSIYFPNSLNYALNPHITEKVCQRLNDHNMNLFFEIENGDFILISHRQFFNPNHTRLRMFIPYQDLIRFYSNAVQLFTQIPHTLIQLIINYLFEHYNPKPFKFSIDDFIQKRILVI